MNRTSLCRLLLVSSFASVLFAQTTSTEVLGTVTDSSGAVVPAAKVTLLRVVTGERREVKSSSTGDYSFPLIDIGEYHVTVEASGFKTQEKTGITLQVNQRARVNFVLEVGAASERIEVVATGVELKTEDATVATVIDNKRVVELPLNGRNVAALAVLTPGVQFGIRSGVDGSGGFPIPGNNFSVSANGQREINQQITLDGVMATEPRVNTMVFTPSIDAIEEFKVQTSSYSAEFGQSSGAVMQIAMKSGTNRFHGTIYEFLRNDKLAAKDYFLNFQVPAGTQLAPKNVLRRNQFGVFLGGPVDIPKVYKGKDKTFWSFNYEGRRETRESVAEAFYYPQAFRNGDFSALLQPLVRNGTPVRSPIIIYDPLTGEPFRDMQGNITNIIPASRINKNAQSFLNKYQPLPMFQPEDILDINTRGSVPNFIRTNQYFWRVDHNFGSKDKVFVRYAADRSIYDSYDLNPNFTYYILSHATNVATQWVHMFSPTLLNEFRYGLNKASDDTRNPRTNTNFDLDSLGIGNFRVAVDNNRKLTSREVGLPSTIIGGDRDGGNGYDYNTVHQFSDNLTKVNGKHTFKAGFDYRRVILDRAAANNVRGSISCCVGAYALSGWLMGLPSGSTTGEGLPFTAPRSGRWSAYFLDDIKVSRKLTANIGLRWDYFSPPVDSDGGWRSLRLDILTKAADGRMLPTMIPNPGVKNFSFYSGDNRYFMPRVGLAYRATEKWVVRTGFGWFANPQFLNNFTILNLMPPRSGTFDFTQVTDTALSIPYSYAGRTYTISTRKIREGTSVITLDNLYPGSVTSPSRYNVTLMTPDNRSSNVYQWSFDVQRTLPMDILLTLGYVGSQSRHLDNSVSNFNSPDPSTNTDINSRRPWQAWVSSGEGNAARGLANIRYLDSYANGSYNGLQVSAEKRYSHGLTAALAYTYSKAIGEGYERNGSGLGISGQYQDPRNRRAARSRYGFDVTHNAMINFVYEPEFLKSFKGVAGAVIGGWQANGIVTLRTGFPFNLSGGNLNTGGEVRPDRVADGRLDGQNSRQLWFDPTAFRRTECNIPGRTDLCHYGNAGNGIITSPGAKNIDFSVGKNWKISPLGEAGRLQFRAEFFNLINTPQFGQPNGIGWATQDSVIPDSTRMGEIRSLRLPMRIVQFGMKLYF
jgi:hypothetical protein